MLEFVIDWSVGRKVPRSKLDAAIRRELPKRLSKAAEAFYYAGILSSLSFEVAAVDAGDYRDPSSAADAAASHRSEDRPLTSLGAPPLVNFAFSIELFLKLLVNLGGAIPGKVHRLDELFLLLERKAPHIAERLVRNHFYSRGCREEFMQTLTDVATVFNDWRYVRIPREAVQAF